MTDCFYETDYRMPDGWRLEGRQSIYTQYYCKMIHTAGKRGFRLHATVDDGDEVSFKTTGREVFRPEVVEAALNGSAEFCEAFWKMKRNSGR